MNAPKIKVVRITISSRYLKPGMKAKLERSILKTLYQFPTLNAALEDGWLEEVRSAGGKNPARRFAIYLTDKDHYHDIPVYFSLMVNGKLF